ncbi:IS1182 family transposase [Methylobacterium frigidaeris]|uniref:IS1182 family transposase ISGdi13 n=3 Tax=Methylobacterium frigidaeris TaxID=2038277 RepID=A0AA37HIG2_9HYPH|nr:IS1182 family transposase [Methylobacterium frigidaeris]GJD65760.1 IS1182 family transposase ISGdi13 [Methylobacterium frigidaeris]
MAVLRSYSREQRFLLPPDLADWVAEDDLAHFVIAAVERVTLDAFKINHRGTGKAQYHPRLMLGLLIYGYANGIFSSRRLERATYRDIGVRFVAADQHPDHDTIAAFRWDNARAFEAAFLQVLLLARESGLLKLGTVSIDGTKIDANASKIRSVRYDRMQALRAKLAADIAALTARAEAADAEDAPDPQALPRELARRETLKAKLDAACARLEAEALAAHGQAKAEHEAKQAAYAARTGRRGKPPVPPDDGPDGNGPPPAPERQSNLTDPDSALMRKSARHEYRQAYNAQAVVDAEGSQLIVATGLATTPGDQPTFAATILAMEAGIGLPRTVLADAGFAGRAPVEALKARGIEPLVAVRAMQGERPYDFRPPPVAPKPDRAVREPWRLAMQATMNTEPAKALYRLRKQTVEPVFGIVKAAMGFRQFLRRGLAAVEAEWTLVALAYNAKRMARLCAA